MECQICRGWDLCVCIRSVRLKEGNSIAVVNDPNTAANIARVGAVDTSAGGAPLHVNIRPDEYGALGHYRGHLFTGNIGAGAGALSELVQLRYTGSGKVVVYSIILEHFRSLGTAFAAGNFLFDVIKSTGWSVDGTGGGTQVPEKLRTSMGAPTTTLRVSTTAALGAGTKTLATNPYRAIRGIVSTGINAIQLGTITAAANVTVGYPGPVPLVPALGDIPAGAHQIVLAQNEGLSCRATVPGTGVWEAAFTILFSEVSNY